MTKPPLHYDLCKGGLVLNLSYQKNLNLNNNEIEISLHLRHKKIKAA